MSKFTIVTDSSCDLPQGLVDKFGVKVVPLSLFIKGEQYYNYLDGSDISFEDYYSELAKGETITTSGVNIDQFRVVMESELLRGYDVLYIGFSSPLSGTYNAAVQAAADLAELYPKRKIYTVDSLSASLGQGLLIYYAATEQKNGKSIEEVRDLIEDNKLKVCHWFTINDLNQLKRSGRINGATATFGKLLGIKPILHMDSEGKLFSVEKARGRNGALKALFSKIEKSGIEPEKQTFFICHGNCFDDAKKLADMISEKFGQKCVINFIGPVIATHTGVGTVGLFFIGSER